MRKWKIRTKMIAGLCGLAIVIGVLIYSSWSQLARDRDLGTEIGHLAEEIRLAHALQSDAALLSLAVIQYDALHRAAPGMIDSNLVNIFEGLDKSKSLPFTTDEIEGSFLRLPLSITKYRHTIADHSETSRSRTLLVDHNAQLASLDRIDKQLAKASLSWKETKRLDDRLNFFDYNSANLKRELETLVTMTEDLATKLQDDMKGFKESVRTEHRAKRNSFWLFTGLAAFLITLLAWQFWTLIVVPFRTLFRGSQLIASGHHQHKILLGTRDEIGMMANTVNDITDRFNQAVSRVTSAKQRAEQEVRDRTREVIQNEQLASVGFLAAGVAHEINNPLGAIAWGAESLEESLDELSDEELSEAERGRLQEDFTNELRTNLGLIQSEAFRCKGITKRLLDFSRLSDATRDQEDIGDLVSRVVSMVGKVGEYRCKTIQMHAEEKVFAHCNSQEIQQVLLNLVSNALESVDTDGQVDVYVRNEVDLLTASKEAVVIVEDDGCGMSREVVEHLFEPFFTRRRDGTGTGLGLSISYRIVSLHHGSLTPYSDGEGHGSKMVLRLPTQPASQHAAESDEEPSQSIRKNSQNKWNDVQKVS